MWYIIIAVVIIALAVAFIYLKKKGNERRIEAENAVKSRFSGKELSEREKRGLTYSAILAITNGEDPLSILPDCGLDHFVGVLREGWGIVSRESAKETIDKLLSLEHSESFDEEMTEESSRELVSEIRMNISKELNVPIEGIEKVKSTYAWDIGRASNLAKWCFWVDYITEEEMFSYLDKCVEIATSKGNDWPDFTYSFLIGRCMHGFKLEDVILDAERLLDKKTTNENEKVYQIISFK